MFVHGDDSIHANFTTCTVGDQGGWVSGSEQRFLPKSLTHCTKPKVHDIDRMTESTNNYRAPNVGLCSECCEKNEQKR